MAADLFREVPDRFGDVVLVAAGRVEGSAVAPRTSVEGGDQPAQVISGLVWYVPSGQPRVESDFRVRFRSGPYAAASLADPPALVDLWRVDGEVGTWESPLTGWSPGAEVRLERVRG